MSEVVIRAEGVHRVYHLRGEDVHAVNDVSFDVHRGTLTVIIGHAGAGKTTLLNVLSGLDTPTQGRVYVEGQDLFALPETKRVKLRREKMGFVFQNFGLLPLLSAAENVSVPLRMRGQSPRAITDQVAEALEWVGLSNRAAHRPYELSGGEQQRVSIARALVAQPDIILADEPTGQLDSQTGRQVLGIMRRLVDEQGITMVAVTHDPQLVGEADDVHRMKDGRLQSADT